MRNLKTLIYLFIIALALNSAFAYEPKTEAEARLVESVKYLASDELEGRFPGTEGMEKAAKYIESYFAQIGANALGASYRQPLLVTTGLIAKPSSIVEFEVVIPKPGLPESEWKWQKRPWIYGTDWVAKGFSETGEVSGEVAFVGYGITAPELKYDDFEGIDVKDKIVIMLTESPDGEGKKGQFEPYTDIRYKAKNARDHGAKGVIFIKLMGDSTNVLDPISFSSISKNSGIVAIQATRTSIGFFFPRNNMMYPAEEYINKNKKPKSFILPNVKVRLKLDLEDVKKETYNIIAFVPGTNPALANEYIVVGAHYDHLGWGGPSSTYRGKHPAVHNGADDNASGTAAVLELARRIKESPLPRPVIFMLYTAEELGLLGSAHYVDNPLVPMENVVAMVNLDMVGRMSENKLNVFGSGSSSSFTTILQEIAEEDSLKVSLMDDAFGPSDHSSFYKMKIPALHVFTGVHGDYHNPNDDWDRINYPGLIKTIDYVEDFVGRVANLDEKPDYKEVTVAKRETKGGYGGGSAWFGIVPNFEESPLGCKISGTSPGSPAQKAGLEMNDIIYDIDGTAVKNLHDFMFAIRERKPGDVLTVKVKRGKDYKEEKVFKVTLAKKN